MTISIGQPTGTAPEGGGNAPYPTTASGKRNWSASAVHGTQNQGTNVKQSGHELVPEYEGGFGEALANLVDIINPLQHIPIVGNIYRAVTGDTINPAGRILGGTLFGGPLGFLSGIGSTLIAETTGKDVGEHLLASLFDGESSTNSASSYSQAAARYESTSRIKM